MLKRFARLATMHPRAVLAGAAVLFVVSVGVGGGVAPLLTSGGFNDPASESSRADHALADQFGTGVPNLVLLVTANEGSVDSPAVARAGRALTAKLARERDLSGVVSYWSEGRAAPLRTDDGRRALVVGRIDLNDDDAADRAGELAPRYRTKDGPVTVQVGGFAEQFHEVGKTLGADLPRAEVIALPIVLVLLAFVFRGVVAALLPLVIGVLSIVGTLLVLRVTVAITDVSAFALNLTTALGLGLAIDYSLLVVSRFREELRAGHEPRAAVSRTVATAGRTVAFSALTVAASLAAALLFPVVVLRSFAYAGVAVALFAGLLSVLVLPAILTLLGTRVNALAVRRGPAGPPEEGRWYRVATFVMRRPIPIATGLIAVLLVLVAPFLGLRLSQADDRVLPDSASSRQVGDAVRNEFASQEPAALSVVAPDAGGGAAPEVDARIAAYAARLATLPDVARVDAASGSYCGAAGAARLGCKPGQLVAGPGASPRYARYRAGRGTYLSVVPAVEPFSPAGERLVAQVRDASAPFPVLVTGRSANLVDTKDALSTRLPFALVFIAVVTFALLFMMFGSVVIPAKALVLNLLSLSATFGALVWIFQDGHLGDLLGITATGGLDPVIPILMFCIAYGLSMDYEVFLLSRIKEEHDRGAGNERAVALGLARTGPIVTAAALIMAVVFVAVGTSRVSFITMFGLGLALAVLLDAFVIRGTLVPAFMRLAGDWNWWAPRLARRFHDRYGISESADPAATPSSTRPANRRTQQRPRGPAA